MVVNSLSLTQITLDLNLVKLHGVCHRGREGKVIRSWKHPPSPHTLTRLAQVPMESSHFGLYPHPKFSKLELSFKHHFEQPFWKECQQGGKKSVSSRLKCNPWLCHSSKEQSLICRRLRRERNAENASQVTHSDWDTRLRNELHPLHVWETVYVDLNNGLLCAREFFLLFSRS